MAKWLGGTHLSSDAIRYELTGDEGGKSRGVISGRAFDVWETMRERALPRLAAGQWVILDATGMSPAFRRLVQDLESKFWTLLIRTDCGHDHWVSRESKRYRMKFDYLSGRQVKAEIPLRAYTQSKEAAMLIREDYRIDTDDLAPYDVLMNAKVFILAQLARQMRWGPTCSLNESSAESLSV